MENLQNLETNVLIEMLVQQTAQLTAKIAERDTWGADQYKYELAMIQAELNSRPQKNATISGTGIEFTFFEAMPPTGDLANNGTISINNATSSASNDENTA